MSLSAGPSLLDAQAEALARRLLSAHPPTRPYGRADLAALPGPVARVLGARLDARVAEATVPPSPFVDAEAAPVQAAAEAWQAAARAAARFPADTWEDALAEAARDALAATVHPAETLAALAFEGLPADALQPAGEAVARTRPAAPAATLPEVAARYVERKNLATLDRAALERLLRRIDRRMAEGLPPDEWSALAAPLFSLAGPAVAAPLVQAFLAAKGADGLAARVSASSPPLTTEAFHALVAGAPPVQASGEAPTNTAGPQVGHADETAPIGLTPGGPTPAPEGASASSEHTAADQATADPGPASPPVAEDPRAAATDETGHAEVAPESTTPVAERVASPLASDPPPPIDPSLAADPPVLPLGPAPLDPLGPETDARRTPSGVIAPPAHLPPPVSAAPLGDEEPLWKRMARAHGTAPSAAASASSAAPPSGPALWQRFASDASPVPPLGAALAPPPSGAAPSPNALPASPGPVAAPSEAASGEPLGALEAHVLGADASERRDWYVRELFGGDAEAYAATLAALNVARTWTEATQVIARDVLRKHRINIYSEPAVAFTDAVQAQMDRQGRGER